MATSVYRMGTAGILVLAAMGCSIPQASAQLFMSVGGGSSTAQGTTSNIGIGGPGSATSVQGLNAPMTGSNGSTDFPLLGQQLGKPLGVNGNPAGSSSKGSFSAAEPSSSPIDSVTNTLMGPVGSVVSQSTTPPAKPPAKRKQASKTATSTDPAPR